MTPVLLALLAALMAGTGASLQQRAANAEDVHAVMDPRLVLRLLRRRAWLAGILIATAGFVVQAAAIATGELVLVEPLLATSVVWALLASARLSARRLGPRERAGLAATVLGAAGFLVVAAPDDAHRADEVVPWSVPLAVLAVVAVVGVTVARRSTPERRGLLLAMVAGASFGTVDAVIKLLSDVADAEGVGGLVGHWGVLAWVIVSPLAFLCQQSAYHATHLGAALPGTTALQPPVAALLGALMFGEQIRGGWAIPAEVAFAVVALVGVVILSSSPLIEPEPEPESEREREPDADA